MNRQPDPPQWILRVLDWWVQGRLQEEIQGDLQELYEEDLQQRGPAKARRRFLWNAIRFIRLSNFDHRHLNLYPMLWKNYFKVAWRQLLRDKMYAAINITGIAVGIACFLVTLLYIQTERSFDLHHPHADRLYRVSQNFLGETGEVVPHAYSHHPLAPTLEDKFTMVEKTLRIFNLSGGYGENGGQFTNPENQLRYIENELYFADSTFFDLFAYPFIEGDPQHALEAPFSIVLKESIAAKYFKGESALGKVLEFRDEEDSFRFTVGGVVADPVGPSHFDFELLASYSSLRTTMPWIDNWHYPPVHNYVLLRQGADVADLKAGLAELPQQIFQGNLAEEVTFDIQSVKDIHLYSHRDGELQPNGQPANLRLFGIIGLLILLIACINYMNLATARAGVRVKEVSIRRIFGAQRSQLMQQFLGESVLFTALGFVLALILLKISLPYVNDLFRTPVEMSIFSFWQLPLLLGGLLAFISLLSGLYPALFLSALRLRNNIQGQWKSTVTNALSVRKGLVVFQFAVSCALIAMALLVHRQVKHLKEKPLGFKEDQVMIIPLRDQQNQIDYLTLKTDFLQLSSVLSATGCSGYPGGRGFSDFFILPRQAAFDSLEVLTLVVDEDFTETFGMPIQSGRDFSPDFPSDVTAGFMINEALAQRLNWDEPVGKELMLRHYYYGEKQKVGRVVGVVEDFHHASLRQAIEPMLFHILPGSYFYNYLSIKIVPDRIEETIAQLNAKWQAFNPDRTFEYHFLDDVFAGLYRQEQQFNALFKLFTGIAVLIACLGLFSLAAFTIERRSKEMAIRKVLGASPTNILLRLSGQFARLGVIASLIALPPAWYAAGRWLETYPYRIDIGWWSFLPAAVAMLLLVILTSGYHALRAANRNPAQVLKQNE